MIADNVAVVYTNWVIVQDGINAPDIVNVLTETYNYTDLSQNYPQNLELVVIGGIFTDTDLEALDNDNQSMVQMSEKRNLDYANWQDQLDAMLEGV